MRLEVRTIMRNHRWLTCLLFVTIVCMGVVVRQAPLILDDLDEMAHVRRIGGFTDLIGLDCYGFFRPFKNLLFAGSDGLSNSLLGTHGFSLILFLITTGIALVFLERLLGSRIRALAGTAIWALAPTMISTATWLSNANILLMTAGVLVGLLLHDHAQNLMVTNKKQQAIGAWGLAAVTEFLALVSYESAVAFIGLAFLCDGMRDRSRWRQKQSWLAYGAYAMVLIFYLAVRSHYQGIMALDNPLISPMSKSQLMISAGWLTWNHLDLWLWPFGRQQLMGSYIWGGPGFALKLITGWSVLAGIIAVAWAAKRRWPLVSGGLVWFLLSFAPAGNFLPFFNGPVNDAYLVLPSLGLAWALVAFWPSDPNALKLRSVRFGIIVLIVWRGTATVESWDWAKAWNNEIELHRRTIVARPDAYGAMTSYARCLLKDGKLAAAEKYVLQAKLLAPWYDQADIVMVSVYEKQGKYELAAATIEQCNRRKPTVWGCFFLGYLNETYLNRPEIARAAYRQAIELPWGLNSSDAASNLGRMLAVAGQTDEAIGVWERALARDSSAASLHANLTIAWREKGDVAKSALHQEAYRRLTTKRGKP